jgi:GPH family glycoside/pentoside/hexuronide:cation symporter
LAFNLVYVATGTYLTFFYTDVAGIDATVVGTMFLVARLFDGVWDLAVGVLMEKLRSKHGKARSWLLYLAVPYAISAALLFTAPNFDATGKVIYAFATYLLSGVLIYTAMNIPYGALSAMMTEDPVDRGLISTIRMVGAYGGALIVASLTLPLVNTFGGGAGAWTLTFSLYGGLALVMFLIVFIFCKERFGVDAPGGGVPANITASKARSFTVKESVVSLLRNKYWLMLTVFGILLLTQYGFEGIYTYYAQDILGDTNLATILFTYRSLIEFAGVFLAIPFVKWIGKRNIALAGSFAVIVGQLVLTVAPTNFAAILIGLGIAGIGVGAMFAVIFGMIGDTIEYEEWRSGIRAEGMVFAGATVGQKIGSAIGGVAVGWMLGFGGYISSMGTETVKQPDSALQNISFVFIWCPLIFAVAMAVLMYFYRLDKEYPRILAELSARAQGSQEVATDATS